MLTPISYNNKRIAKNTLLLHFRMHLMMVIIYTSFEIQNVLKSKNMLLVNNFLTKDYEDSTYFRLSFV